MLKKPFVCLFLLCVGFQPSLSSPPEKGIFVRPIKTDGGYVGESGQLVSYSYVDSRKLDIWVTLNDTTHFNVFRHDVIPYDSIFAPSTVCLLLLEDPWQVFATQDVMQQERFRYLLTKNTCYQFPSHHLHEYFCAQLVRYTAGYFTGGRSKPTQAIAIAREYLDNFPHGRFKDEVEWRPIQLENWDYGYEGVFIEQRQPSNDQQEVPKRILDLELGLGFPSGLNFCAELFPLGWFSLAGCFETAVLIADVSFGVRYRVPIDEISFEGVYRGWRLGPLVGLRKRLWEFEGPAKSPWQADIGGSLEYVRLPIKGVGFTLGIDLGARVRLDLRQQSAPVFLRITAGWAF
jgi:hypothetical protein